MNYFLRNPGMLVLLFITVVGWALFLLGCFKLGHIIKDRISFGSGTNSPKKIAFSAITFIMGLSILLWTLFNGSLFIPD